MSKSTMTLKTLMEAITNKSKHVDYNSINSLIDEAMPLIFEQYPIYDESDREALNRHILSSYLTREICVTPYGNWKWKFNERLRDIMPYYNELYKTVKMQYNPLINVDYTRSGDRQDTQNKTTTGNDKTNRTTDSTTITDVTNTITDNTINANSNTPQGTLENAKDLKYLSSVGTTTKEDSNKTESSVVYNGVDTDILTRNNTESGSGNETYAETIKGKIGGESYSNLVKQYRENILNVEQMIVDDMEELFFLVYD